MLEARWEFLKQTKEIVGRTLTKATKQVLQKISLYLESLFEGWQEYIGFLERDYVGSGCHGSRAACQPVDSMEAHKLCQGGVDRMEVAGSKVKLVSGAGEFFLPFDGARN